MVTNTPLAPLKPRDFFDEVRIGDFIVLTPEGLRYFVVDLEDDPLEEGNIIVWGGSRGGLLHVRLSTYTTIARDKEGEYHPKENTVVWAQRCSIELERVVEVLRLSPGSWMMQRSKEPPR